MVVYAREDLTNPNTPLYTPDDWDIGSPDAPVLATATSIPFLFYFQPLHAVAGVCYAWIMHTQKYYAVDL